MKVRSLSLGVEAECAEVWSTLASDRHPIRLVLFAAIIERALCVPKSTMLAKCCVCGASVELRTSRSLIRTWAGPFDLNTSHSVSSCARFWDNRRLTERLEPRLLLKCRWVIFFLPIFGKPFCVTFCMQNSECTRVCVSRRFHWFD